jgi:hypothetical protein
MTDLETRCPACGEPIDYCQGHGELGDPEGHAVLQQHDDDDHVDCHPIGCEFRRTGQEDHPWSA